jgi:hypothetical protein
LRGPCDLRVSSRQPPLGFMDRFSPQDERFREGAGGEANA